MTAARQCWLAVYAAVLGGLAVSANPNLSWDRCRERAQTEADEAVRRMKESA